jgi:E3 ubiquitin-protein ligase synoviolin
MDQRPYPGPPKLFHVRMNSLFFILWTVDFVMFAFAVESTVTNGVSGMVLFASEVSPAPTEIEIRFRLIFRPLAQYAILMASALNTSAKYFLSLYELRRASQRGGENAPPWENKSMWVFYIELSTGISPFITFVPSTCLCAHSRLPEVDDIPRLLHPHYHILWFTTKHRP